MTTVALAALLAVLGIVAVLAYVGNANTRAIEGKKAVSVLVANGTIPEGTSLSSALKNRLLTHEVEPAASVPSDVLYRVTQRHRRQCHRHHAA